MQFCSELSSLTLSGVMGLFSFLLRATCYGNENGPRVPISSALEMGISLAMEGSSARCRILLVPALWCWHLMMLAYALLALAAGGE